MDRRYIETHAVVSRYVKNRLSPDELEAFEEYFFEHPEMTAEITAERELAAALEAHRDWDARPVARRAAPFALAAAVVAAAGLGAFAAFRATLEPEPVQVAQRGFVVATRSTGLPEVPVASLERPLVLTVETNVGPDSSFGGVLRDGDGRSLWSGSPLAFDSAGNVTLVISPPALRYGEYALEVTADGERRGRYEFRIVPLPTGTQ